MKKALAWLSCTAIAFSMAAGLSLSASAASGADVQETFEFYKSKMTFNALWNVSEGQDAIKLSIDDTDSAPNRANGEAKGNYRCLKMELDMDKAKTPDAETGGYSSYVAFVGKLEDKDTMIESIKSNDQDAYLSFYAKASKSMRLWVGLNVCDAIYYAIPTIDSASWKEYKISLKDFKAWKGQESVTGVREGETVFDVCARSGFYGTKDGEFRGFKFAVLTSDQPADMDNGYKGTVKLDTLAFKGQYFNENGDEDMDLDKAGKKPDNFVPVTTPTTTTKNGSGNNSSGNNSSVNSSGGNNSSGSSSNGGSGNDSTSASVKTTMTLEGQSTVPTDETGNTAGGGSETRKTTGTNGGGTENVGGKENPEKKGGSIGWIIAVVVIVVLAGGGAAFYFLYWKKRPAGTGNGASEDSKTERNDGDLTGRQ